jgi:multidrug resistance efflux pump
VEEGDAIRRGQLLAELANDDNRAQVASAEADVTAKEATLRKVLNGARSQERLEAWSSARAAEALMNNARSEMERRSKLYDAPAWSRERKRSVMPANMMWQRRSIAKRWSTTRSSTIAPGKKTNLWQNPI